MRKGATVQNEIHKLEGNNIPALNDTRDAVDLVKRRDPLWTQNYVLHFITAFLLAFGLYFYIATLPLYVVNVLRGSNQDIGLVISLFSLTAVLVRPFIGYFLDKYGRKAIQIGSILLMACAHGAYLFAGSIMFLLILRLLHGIPWGMTQTAVGTVAVDIIPESRRGEGLGYFGMTFTLAAAFGPMISLIIEQAYGFTVVFIAGTLLALIAAGTSIATRFPEITHTNAKLAVHSMIEKRVIGTSFATLLTTTAYGALISFITIYSRDQNLPSAGWYFTISAIGTMAARFRAGHLFDKYGPRWLLIFGYSSLILAFLLLGMFPSSIPYGVSAFLLGAGFGINIPTFQTMSMNVVEPYRRGAATATLFSAFDIGIALGALGLGILAEKTGFQTMYITQALFLGIPLMLFIIYIIPKYYANVHALQKQSSRIAI